MRALRDLLPGLLGALLASTLSSLLAADTSTVVGVALVTLALTALHRPRFGELLLAGHAVTEARVATADLPPPLPGPATDPVHHPLRPRAPGHC